MIMSWPIHVWSFALQNLSPVTSCALVCYTDFPAFWKVQNEYCMVANIFSPKGSFTQLTFESEKSVCHLEYILFSLKDRTTKKHDIYRLVCSSRKSHPMKVDNFLTKLLILYVGSKCTRNYRYAFCVI